MPDTLVRASDSQVQKYRGCPTLWWYSRNDPIVDTAPPDARIVDGSVAHALVAQALGKPYTELEGEVNFKREKLAETALTFLSTKVVPTYIYGVEVELEIPGLFKGVVDLCCYSEKFGTSIFDWKFTQKIYTEHDIRTALQLRVYPWLWYELLDELVQGVAFITVNPNTFEPRLYWREVRKEEFIQTEKDVRYYQTAMTVSIPRNEKGCIGYEGEVCPYYSRCWPEVKIETYQPNYDFLGE